MARDYLTDFELMILLSILRVGDEAYGVPIAREMETTERFFRVTPAGLKSVRQARRALTQLWTGLPQLEGGRS